MMKAAVNKSDDVVYPHFQNFKFHPENYLSSFA